MAAGPAHILRGADTPALRAALAEPVRQRLSRLQWAAAGVLAVVLLAWPLVFTGPFPRHVMILLFITALAAQGWNILAGYCGQISLGHAVFFGVGVYASGFLFAQYGVIPWVGLLVGIVVAMALAAAIGLPTLRLRGHYFAIATLVIGEAFRAIMLRWDYFGAASGVWLPIVRENAWLNFQFHESKLPYYYIALAFLVAGCLVVYALERTRPGYYFRAIREDPEGAASLGVNVSLYKVYAFMLSGTLVSVAGSFNVQYVLIVDPESDLALLRSILVVLVAMLGGVGSMWGPIIGAAVLVPLQEATRIWFGGTGGAVDLMIYGALIMIICLYQPSGLVGLLNRLTRRREPPPAAPEAQEGAAP